MEKAKKQQNPRFLETQTKISRTAGFSQNFGEKENYITNSSPYQVRFLYEHQILKLNGKFSILQIIPKQFSSKKLKSKEPTRPQATKSTRRSRGIFFQQFKKLISKFKFSNFKFFLENQTGNWGKLKKNNEDGKRKTRKQT